MKENMFDVLLYLFENYLDDEAALVSDQDSLRVELHEAGFDRAEINKAFDWLDQIASHAGSVTCHAASQPQSIRVFLEAEQKRLDVTCRGFLMYLERVGVLDETTRELVIDRTMALDVDHIDLDRLKWVVLMVLLNRPDQEARLAWMEDLILDNIPRLLH
jgi:Smg protein